MKSFNLFLIFVLSLSLALSGCFFKESPLQVEPDNSIVPEKPAVEETNVVDKSTADSDKDSQLDQVTENGLLPLCEDFYDARFVTTCDAALTKDLDKCDSIYDANKFDKTYYQAQCRVLVAAAMGEVSMCDKIDRSVDAGQGTSVRYSATKVDCIEPFAIANKDKKLCEREKELNSVAGCKQRYEIEYEDIPLEDCNAYDYECYFKYAYIHRDASACDGLKERSDDILRKMRIVSCKAMVNADVKMCNELVDKASWYYCEGRALYGEAVPKLGEFYPKKCGNSKSCQELVMIDLIREFARTD